MHIKHWINQNRVNSVTTAIEVNSIDLDTLFRYFAKFSTSLKIPIYYWNSGYESLQKMETDRQENIRLASGLEVNKTTEINYILKYFLQSDSVPQGIYLLDDLCNFEELKPEIIREREALIANLNRKYARQSVARQRVVGVPPIVATVEGGRVSRLQAALQPSVAPASRLSLRLCGTVEGAIADSSVYIVLLGEYLQFSSRLAACISTFKIPLPSRAEIETLVRAYFDQAEILDWNKLLTALQGLSCGEIELLLQKHSDTDANILVDRILEHKISRWRGIGLEFFAEPDVKSAGGNDLLQKYLHEVVGKLSESRAKQYNLRPPKGMLLMGPPGTGKSLCAKLAAKALGYPLLGLSWGNVLGAHNPDKALAQILEVADCLDNCVILADDFDKGFTGWSEGGASRRLSQRLLTWMQEHTSNALMIATVNRIQLLPSDTKSINVCDR